MNKTILLNFAHRPMQSPMKYRLIGSDDNTMTLESTNKQHRYHTTVRRLENGNWMNDNHCEFVVVKADRRPKPFTVKSREEGRGKPTVHKFATLAELQTYVKDRWQGVEYMDGANGFHSDYCTFDLTGATLFDLGNIDPQDCWSWIWKEIC